MHRHTLQQRPALSALAATALSLLSALPASAQTSPPASAPAAAAVAPPPSPAPATVAAKADAEPVDPSSVIVITGTGIGRTRLSAPFAISAFDEKQLERNAPASAVDMLRRVPGFSVEASGGQGGGQNIYARGLPGGGWFYVQLQNNGLTLWDEPQESFLNIDTLYSLDMMTERVEVVRGGTSALFANNAPGGTVNIITRKGSQVAEGALRLTLGSHDLRRVEGFASGPLSDRVTYAVGGFYRQGKGLREPGFTADKGGQLTAAGSLRLDNGRLDVELKLLNDRTAFYTGIPLNDPRNPSVSLAGQLDPGTGTLASNDFRFYSPRFSDAGTAQRLQRDLADGIHTDTQQFGSTFEHALPWGVKLVNRLGAVNAKVSYDALFSGAAPQDAAAYLASQLTRAQAGFGNTVTRTGYVLANARGSAGARIGFDPASSGGLVLESGLFAVDTSLKTVTNDLRLSKSFELGQGRKNDLVIGLYGSRFSFEQRRVLNTLLTSLVNRPQALDVLAYNAAGGVVGSVTEDGFTRYGNGVLQGRASGTFISPYLSDAWQITDKLTLDAGLRHTRFSEDGQRWLTGAVDQGNAGTLADNNVGALTGAVVEKSESLTGTSWTVGSAYKLADTQQLFARFTRSVRFPRPQNVYANQSNPVTAIKQAEGGWRTGGPLSLSAIAFYSHFDRLTLNGLVLNAQGQLVTLPLIGETETKGLEFEVNWRASGHFSVNANLTAQDPKTKSLFNVATGLPAANTNNKQIQSIPKLLASVQPVAYFSVGGLPLEVSATASHVGRRFVDYANSTALPAYTTVDLSLLASVSSSLDLTFQVRNATNSHGLTEGNPRTDSLVGQGTPTAIYGRPVFGRNFQASLTYRW